MKKLIVVFLFVNSYSMAQKVELGGGGGMTFYQGDLHPKFGLLSPGVAGNAFFRYNFDRVLSAKASITYGVIRGDDNNSTDPFLKQRGFSFDHTVMDYYVQLEYNFLNFRSNTGRYEHHWTPYLFGGYGKTQSLVKNFHYNNHTHKVTNQRGANDIIPFGIGIKKILGPRLNLTAEFSTRVFLNKVNGAAFDGLSPSASGQNNNSYSHLFSSSDPLYNFIYYSNIKQKDKYFHASVTLSYLIYRVHCNNPNSKFTFF